MLAKCVTGFVYCTFLTLRNFSYPGNSGGMALRILGPFEGSPMSFKAGSLPSGALVLPSVPVPLWSAPPAAWPEARRVICPGVAPLSHPDCSSADDTSLITHNCRERGDVFAILSRKLVVCALALFVLPGGLPQAHAELIS